MAISWWLGEQAAKARGSRVCMKELIESEVGDVACKGWRHRSNDRADGGGKPVLA